MLSPIEIPTMLFWENGNTWYGSKGEARFSSVPLPMMMTGAPCPRRAGRGAVEGPSQPHPEPGPG